jgi:hypothetical protein
MFQLHQDFSTSLCSAQNDMKVVIPTVAEESQELMNFLFRDFSIALCSTRNDTKQYQTVIPNESKSA